MYEERTPNTAKPDIHQ